MKILLGVFCLAFTSFAVVSHAEEEKKEDETKKFETIIVPVEGVTEFTVTGRSTLFRLPISTIAGGTISEPKITGKVKLIRKAEITLVEKGGVPLIGSLNKEFVFQGTAAGKATIEFEKKLPTEPKPVIVKYTVMIE